MEFNFEKMPATAVYQNGFQKLHSFGEWRIMTSGIAEQERPRVLQKHECTDEVFVLVRGNGFMLLGEAPDQLQACPMKEGYSYVVPRGMWHAHVLEAGSQILIVENDRTNPENSPIVDMADEQVDMYEKLIGGNA